MSALLFSVGYYLVNKDNQSDIYKEGDKELLNVVNLSETLIGVESEYIDGVEIVYIINNSDHLLSVDITLSNGSDFENTGLKYIRPYGVEIYVIENAFGANKYEFDEFTFYKSINDSSIDYAAYYRESEVDGYDISLYKEMSIKNIKEILNEEKDYIEYSENKIQKYYFYDIEINTLAEFPSEGSHIYLGIINNYNKEIEIYENVDGKDVLLENIKY